LALPLHIDGSMNRVCSQFNFWMSNSATAALVL